MNVKIVENEKELEDAFSVRRTVFVEEQNVPVEEEIDELEDEATHFVAYLKAHQLLQVDFVLLMDMEK